MRFEKYYIESDSGKSNCVVRTCCKLLGFSYQKVFTDLCNIAKELNCSSFNDIEVFETYFKKYDFYKSDIYIDEQIKNINLDNGEYIIFCYDKKEFYHMIPIIDNVIYDKSDECLDLYIISVYKKDIRITINQDKDPYIRDITEDKVINVTGQSGSGKSTYIENNYNNDDYIILDTDVIIGNSSSLNKYDIEFKEYLFKKYDNLSIENDFDTIYEEMINYFKGINKTIVIDCAQFHAMKDISKLKGRIIVIRTCIDKCYERVIDRYKKRNPNINDEELNKYKERKKGMYSWYKGSNEFLIKVDNLIKNKV